MLPDRPLVSYVVPVFNYGRYVGLLLDSLLAQDYSELEVIVVDDCSTDNSLEIVEKYCARDERIRVIRATHNRGVGASDAAGVAESRGDLVAIVDADDMLLPQKTSRQVAFLREHPEVSLVGTYVSQIDADGVEQPDGEQPAWSNQRIDLNAPVNWLWRNHLCRSSVMVRRAVFEKIGLPSAAHRSGQDYDLWLRALEGGFEFAVLPEALTIYRVHGSSISRQHNIDRKRFFSYAVSCYQHWHPFLVRHGRGDLVFANLQQFVTHPLYLRDEGHIGAKLWEVLTLPPDESAESAFARVDRPPQPNAALIPFWLTETGRLRNEVERSLRQALENEHRAYSVVTEEVHRLNATAAELRKQQGERHAHIAELTLQLDRLALKYEEERQALRRVEAERHSVLEQREQLVHAKEVAEDHVSRLLHSRSYRTGRLLSAPMRIAKRLVKKSPLLSKAKDTVKEEVFGPGRRYVRVVKWPSSRPLVSVVIPCFNYGQYVGEAVSAVLAQTFQDFEIIIVDGGSTDGTTREIVRRLVRDKVRVFLRASARPVGSNRNFGISRARGKYIVCLDADDRLESTYLEKAVFLAEAGGFDLVHPAVQCFGNTDLLWENHDAKFAECVDANQVATVALFRKADWKAAGGYVDFGRGESYIFEDWEFWVRLLGRGARAKVIREPLMQYRTHPYGLTAGARMPIEQQREKIKLVNRKLFLKANVARVSKREGMPVVVYRPLLNLERTKFARTEPAIFVAIPSPESPRFELVLFAAAQLQRRGYAITFLADQLTLRRDLAGMQAVARLRQLSHDIFDFSIAPSEALRAHLLTHLLESRQPEFVVIDDSPSIARMVRSRQSAEFVVVSEVVELPQLLPQRSRLAPRNLQVLLCVPWLDRGGSSALMQSIFSRLVDRLDVHVVATNPVRCEHGIDRGLYDYASSILDLDVDTLGKSAVVAFVCWMLDINVVFIVGSRSAYDALETIKQRQPQVRVIDQLYNPVGHVSANRAAAHLIDHNVVASSEVVAALLGRGARLDELTLLQHGVDLRVFTPTNPEYCAAQRASEHRFPTVGFLGRLSEEKRPLDVLEISARMSDLAFRLAGSGPMANSVQKHHQALSPINCEILGHVSVVLAFYASIDVLLLTSSIEGTPITLLEAMALEKIVVATRVGNIPSVVEDGVTGFLFEPGNLDQLQACLRAVANLSPENRAAMGRSARARIEREHDIDKIAHHYLDLLQPQPAALHTEKESQARASLRS